MNRTTVLWTTIGVIAMSSAGSTVMAASHLWRFNEVFTNASGTIQFVELKECCGADAEIFLSGKWIKSDATGVQFNFPSDLNGGTANKYLLLGTAGFAALPGAPTPDFILPNNFFSRTNPETLRYWLYTDATMSFAAGAVPTDGVNSLRIDGTTGVNTPTNFSGQSGSVSAAPCVDPDGDGYGSPGSPLCANGSATDCDNGNAAIHPGATELCADGLDNDCDNVADCADHDCRAFLACVPTLSQWGVLVMGLALLVGGTLLQKRRQAQVRVNED